MNIKEFNIRKLKPLNKTRYSNYFKYQVIGKNKTANQLNGTIEEIVEILRNQNKDKTIVPSGIFKCASNYYPKYFGYKWEFVNEEDKKEFDIFESKEARDKMLNSSKENKKKLIVYDKSGDPIEGFENIFEALRWLKTTHNSQVDYKSILYVAKNYQNPKKAQTAKGFRWRFLEDVLIDK